MARRRGAGRPTRWRELRLNSDGLFSTKMEQNTVIYKKNRQNLPCTVRFPKPAKNNGTMADKHIWLNRSHVVWISIHAEEYIQVVPLLVLLLSLLLLLLPLVLLLLPLLLQLISLVVLLLLPLLLLLLLPLILLLILPLVVLILPLVQLILLQLPLPRQ